MAKSTYAIYNASFIPPPGVHAKLSKVASGNWAWQSSTDGDAVASRAVDGDANPDVSAGSCSQTTESTYPIWAVDMEAIRDVHFVDVVICKNIGKCSGPCNPKRLYKFSFDNVIVLLNGISVMCDCIVKLFTI